MFSVANLVTLWKDAPEVGFYIVWTGNAAVWHTGHAQWALPVS